MKRQRMAEQWERFARECLHPDAPPIQHAEMRRAFYAGAQAFVCIMGERVTPGPEVTDADNELISDLRHELFGDPVGASRT